MGLFERARRSLEGADRPRPAPLAFEVAVLAVETENAPGDTALWLSLPMLRLSLRRPREDRLELRPLALLHDAPSSNEPMGADAESRALSRLETFLTVADGADVGESSVGDDNEVRASSLSCAAQSAALVTS